MSLHERLKEQVENIEDECRRLYKIKNAAIEVVKCLQTGTSSQVLDKHLQALEIALLEHNSELEI